MLRAAVLSILVLVSVIVMLPTADSSAHNNGRASVSRRSRVGRRHSRAWWRRYRARMRRRRAALRRRQAVLRTRRGTNLNAMADSHKSANSLTKLSTVSTYKDVSTGWSPALPSGWSRHGAVNGAMKFVINGQDGRSVGEATLSITNGRSSGDPLLTSKAQRKMLGGVPFTELRRTVIDKMITANGWVVNDLRREIDGRPVFIVLAQTPASSDGLTPPQSWVFYFTEADGRIYTLATNSGLEFADRVAAGSTQLMASFPANRPNPETSLR